MTRGTIEHQIAKNILREAVGRAIFCPQCKGVLDMRRAVELDFYRGDDLAGVRVMCARCYDAKCANGKLAAQLDGTGLRFEPVDGREL